MFKLITKLVLGTSLFAAFFPPGVPSNPPFPVTGTKTTGYVPTVQSDGTVAWAAGGGGGLTVTGTPAEGETVTRNTFDGTWVPSKPGAGVIDVTSYGASGRGEITTTGTISASGTSLAVASASTLAKGQGIDVIGAGTSHGLSAPSTLVIGVLGTAGAANYTLGVSCISAGAGYTAVGTVATTTGNATLSSTNALYLCWDNVANNCGFWISGDSATQASRSIIARKNRATNAYKLQLNVGATGFVQTDVGKNIQISGVTQGVLAGYDNTARTAYVIPSVYADNTFPSGTITTSGGTGTGVLSSAGTPAHVWKYSGHTAAIATETQPSLARRVSSVYYPGDMIVHPVGPTGEWWICDHVLPTTGQKPTTNSTATASLTLGSAPNASGTIAQDGDIFWRRIDGPMPVDEPTAAVQNTLRTTIDAISGTTITTHDAAGTSVTSLLVMHDDGAAIASAFSAANTANAKADTVYFPPGKYNWFLGDSEADPYSQWDDAVTATNYALSYSTTNADRRITLKMARSAQFQIMSASNRALHQDSGDNDYIFFGNTARGFSLEGGEVFNVQIAEPRIIASDAWNRHYLIRDHSSGSTQRIGCTRFVDANVWGFGRVISIGTDKGWGAGLEIYGGDFSWGGAGHDAFSFGTFGRGENADFFGHIAFGSDVCYTDDATIEDKTILIGCNFINSRNNGVRLRNRGNVISDCHWVDGSGQLVYCENFEGAVSNCTATNGGQFYFTGQFAVSNLSLTNAQLVASGNGSITGGAVVFTTAADSYFSSGEHCVKLQGGTITLSGTSIINNETAGPAKGLNVTGSGTYTINGVDCYSNADIALDVDTSMSGMINVTGGRFRAGGATEVHYLVQEPSATGIYNGVTFLSPGNDDTVRGADGKLYMRNCTSYCPLSMSSNLDGLELTNNAIGAGAAGTTVIAYAGAMVQGNTFGNHTITISGANSRLISNDLGASPTLSGATLLTNGNLLSGIAVASPSALSSGTTDDYALPITNFVRLDPNASNSVVTSFVARASGTVITIYCTDAGAATLTIDDQAASGTAANKILTKGGTDAVLSNKEYITLMYDGVQSRWVEIGGSY